MRTTYHTPHANHAMRASRCVQTRHSHPGLSIATGASVLGVVGSYKTVLGRNYCRKTRIEILLNNRDIA